MKTRKQPILPFLYKMVAAMLGLVAMFIVSLVFGAAEIEVKDVWAALTSGGDIESRSIIQEIRLPREVAAMVVGSALAVAGAIMQGMTRNPLADPGLLGLTAGANAMLAVALAFLPSANYFVMMVFCFLGAAIGATVVFGIGAMKKGGFSPFRIVLAGAAVSALLTAIAEGIGIYFKLSKEVSMWTAGGLIGTNWNQLQIIVPFILAGLVLALLFSKQLTVLSLNEEVAIGLGQNTKAIKPLLFIVVILLAGAAVALVGNMAFIGLMVPHIVRAFVGTDYRAIIPMSIIFGAIFMLMADTLGRTINAPYETPIAAIVSIMGLPFFLLVLRKGERAFS